MSVLLFATTNSRKITEANATLSDYDIVVEPIKLDIDEIQHRDPAEIAKAKARSAYKVINKPVVVSDTSWSIPALGGFPGGYMKDVSAWFKPSDWTSLMADKQDRTIYCHEHIAYFDGEQLQHFESTYKGVIINEARGIVSEDESIEQVAILYGDKTMAEQKSDGGIASAGEVLEHWRQFGEWYSNLA
jgi:XTP/dITP diphosphohydrolase